jgi:uncharacterized SAM-binding protein YcdF (DUF218 family)
MLLVDTLISPLGFGLLLGALLWLTRRRLPRWAWRAGIVAELVCLVLSTSFGAGMLVAFQQSRSPVAGGCAAPVPTTIVLLAGGMRHAPAGPDDIDTLNSASLHRTIAGAALFRHVGAAQLVITGGRRGEVAESTLMAAFARRLGVPGDEIRIEGESLTTWDNAQRVRALEPALPRRIWLVTSALHMPRAAIAFRAAGFEPCFFPTDYLTAMPPEWTAPLPSGAAVANAESVLHELVGEIVYRVRARFGAPATSPGR